MTKQKDSDEGSEAGQHRRNSEHATGHHTSPSEAKDSDEGGTPPQRNRDGDRRGAHIEYLTRRLEGGAPPTPQAYARAARQWQHLPGAVSSVPLPDLPPAQDVANSIDANAAPSTSDTRNQEQQT